ncbi:MAG TPA: hypothetical protein VN039_01825, partial [Nitrospira sp.]|nr:hypothetical protein [Nitrospira sp.]
DLDQKDINFRSTNPDGYVITDLVRAYVRNKLSDMNFGQQLDDFERRLAIDGTAVWKVYEEGGKLINLPVDLLNIYIDPTTPSIQEAYRFTERSLMFPEQIKSMSGWMNTDGIDKNVPTGLPRTDPLWVRQNAGMSNVKMVDVYETWGKIPKSLITGIASDDGIEIEGHLVVSGIDSPGTERLHLIEENLDGAKPYEEAWYTRVPNRWYGRGVAEKLLMLQTYSNLILNVRINRARVSQLGLFKIKKGAGITPQMLARLPSNGAVVLNDMEDLQQFVMQEVGQSSYSDEGVVNSLSERLTNAFESVTGESLPSSTPATNAVLQNRSAMTGFTIIKDELGMFLKRWMDRHALRILLKEMKGNDLIRFSTDDDQAQQLIDRIVVIKAHEALAAHYEQGVIPSPIQIASAMEEAQSHLKQRGDLFIEMDSEVTADELECEVYITNEEMDVGVILQNLITMLQAAPEYHDTIVKEAFDLMGLAQPPKSQHGMPGAPQGAPANIPMPALPGAQLQQATTAGNVPQL